MSSRDLQLRERALRDQNAAAFEAWYVANKGAWFEATERATVRARAGVRRESRVLDVGCGTGRMVRDFAPRVGRVIGLDFSLASLAVLQTTRPAEVGDRISPVGGSALQLPLAARSVDRIVSVQVVQHLPTPADRLQALSEMYRVLRPDGRIVLIVYRWGGIVQGQPSEVMSNGLYRHAYTPDELKHDLVCAGFRQVRVGGMIHWPRLARLKKLGTAIDLWLGRWTFLTTHALYLYGVAAR